MWTAGCDGAPVVAITGGTGTVGRALVRQLASQLPGHRLILLTRLPEQVHLSYAAAVFADLRQPNLGLDSRVHRLLSQRADLFVNCAADIRFNLPVDEARRVNTSGARNVLNVARSCRNLRHFAHISTLYVAGRQEGLVQEKPLRHNAGYVNSYEASKHEAEQIVLSESAKLPAGIYRLSSVTDPAGNSGHFRQVLRFAAHAPRFPFFPGREDVRVDVISSEWAARAITSLIVHHATPGCIRHICAGYDGALSVRALLERTLAAYEPISRRPRPHVDLVPLADFERLRAQMRPGSRISQALDSLMTFIPHLCLRQPFDNTVTSALLAGGGVPNTATEQVFSGFLAQELGSRSIALRGA